MQFLYESKTAPRKGVAESRLELAEHSYHTSILPLYLLSGICHGIIQSYCSVSPRDSKLLFSACDFRIPVQKHGSNGLSEEMEMLYL